MIRPWSDNSVSEMLDRLGYSKAPSPRPRCRTISRDGVVVGHFDCFAAADLVRPEWDALYAAQMKEAV